MQRYILVAQGQVCEPPRPSCSRDFSDGRRGLVVVADPIPPPTEWQGYAKADFVKVGPTLQGLLTSLFVERGAKLGCGAPLFDQDDVADRAAADQATRQLRQAERQLVKHSAGAEELFRENVSSVAPRKQLEVAIEFAREGDTLVVTKIDRLARSVRHLYQNY